MFSPQHQNALLAFLLQNGQSFRPQNALSGNMLAAADDGFDPNGPVARMLRAQRAAEAARAAQAQKAPHKPAQRPGTGTYESANETLRRRMREAGLE